MNVTKTLLTTTYILALLAAGALPGYYTGVAQGKNAILEGRLLPEAANGFKAISEVLRELVQEG